MVHLNMRIATHASNIYIYICLITHTLATAMRLSLTIHLSSESHANSAVVTAAVAFTVAVTVFTRQPVQINN